MKLDKKQVMNNLQNTGLTVVGVAGTFAASKLAPSSISKFVPYVALVGGILAPAFIKSPAAKSLLSGVGVYGALATVSGLTKDETGNVATTGIKAMIASYVPQLGEAPSIGQTWEYNENSVPLLGQLQVQEEYPMLAGVDGVGVDDSALMI